MPRADELAVLARLRAYYVERGIERAADAPSIPSLLDTVIRYEIYKSPRLIGKHEAAQRIIERYRDLG